MQYTKLYAHLEERYVNHGEIVNSGDRIGRMGTTGMSTAIHLHSGLYPGRRNGLIRMSALLREQLSLSEAEYRDLIQQHHYFVDAGLFGVNPVVTAGYMDPLYVINGKFIHHVGLDLVPWDRHKTTDHYDAMWNRSKPGEVLVSDWDRGYGNYVLIAFEA